MAVNRATLRATIAPTPTETAITCTPVPSVLPATVARAARRPRAMPRDTTNRTLGPGKRSRAMDAAVNDPICAHVMAGHGTGGSVSIPNDMLVELPPQPAGVPWPTTAWPTGDPPPELEKSVDGLFAETDRWGTTYAVAIVHEGR